MGSVPFSFEVAAGSGSVPAGTSRTFLRGHDKQGAAGPLSYIEIIATSSGPEEVFQVPAAGACELHGPQNARWVRYYYPMGTLILKSLEVIDIPTVIRTAEDNRRDSDQHLKKLTTLRCFGVA